MAGNYIQNNNDDSVIVVVEESRINSESRVTLADNVAPASVSTPLMSHDPLVTPDQNRTLVINVDGNVAINNRNIGSAAYRQIVLELIHLVVILLRIVFKF